MTFPANDLCSPAQIGSYLTQVGSDLTKAGAQITQLGAQAQGIQKPYSSNYTSLFNHRFFCYAIGGASVAGVLASCVASMLVPAIGFGSIGVIAFASIMTNKSVIKMDSENLTEEASKVDRVLANTFSAYKEAEVDSDSDWEDDQTIDTPKMFPQKTFGKDERAEVQGALSATESPEAQFLKDFRSYIVSNGALNCESLRDALFQQDYQAYFVPRQLLEEISSVYQSIQDSDLKGVKIKGKELLSYSEDKIKSIKERLEKRIYEEQPDQEQKKLIEIIHKQAESEKCKGTESFEKYQFLDKKMTLIGSLCEILSRYEKLDQAERNHFSEKAKHAYEHAKKIRQEMPLN